MGEFQRSPSKVWWAGEDSMSWRAASASPGSQDSGFSDTETSPPIPINLIKQSNSLQLHNLSANVVEKSTPQKSIRLNFNTPLRRPSNMQSQSEPAGRFTKNKGHQQKVIRNLFRGDQLDSTMETDQYANHGSIGSEVTSSENSWASSDSELPDSVKTLPLMNAPGGGDRNVSAPAILSNNESDSELEELFRDSPKHTSTPKAAMKKDDVKLGRIHAINLMQKYINDRVPPTTVESIEEGTALRRWMEELKPLYEPECMTTLQCKSIAGELAETVSQLASKVTSRLRHVINSNCFIEKEFDSVKNEKKNKRPLALSLISKIRDFLSNLNEETELERICCQLETSETEHISKLTARMHVAWNSLYRLLLQEEIKLLIFGLEDPRSEVDVRAKLTALTSITLRHEDLIDLFISSGAVQAITTLCEKCEGSSVRGLALRALSALCINAAAIRKFETCNGIYIITETVSEESRPEPERVEATALLAQITAPWIEDNHNVTGLHRQSKKLIRSITKILKGTQCCQNILLCTAALANLTTMDQKCIKYLLANNTANILLNIIKGHGMKTSVYLLEQVATLIANMSSVKEARIILTQDSAPVALMCFLQSNSVDEKVLMRLQQKSMIGLSRLCGEIDAARQVVELGGVDRLVKLCREKKERYDSDAILVAALATLRKIAEACGAQVVSAEDAQELIEPKLLDSFMAYSAQNESLV